MVLRTTGAVDVGGVSISGSGTTYRFEVQATGSGTVAAAVAPAAVVDAAGNASLASTSTDDTVTIARRTQVVVVADVPDGPLPYGSTFRVVASATSALPVTLATDGPCAVDPLGVVTITGGSGTCTVTGVQPGDASFAPASATALVAAAPAPLVVTAPDATVALGDPEPPLEPTLAGLVGDDDVRDAGTFTCAVSGPVEEVGTQPITCTGTPTGLYSPTYVDGLLTVTAAPADGADDEEEAAAAEAALLPDTGAPAPGPLLLGALLVAGGGLLVAAAGRRRAAHRH